MTTSALAVVYCLAMLSGLQELSAIDTSKVAEYIRKNQQEIGKQETAESASACQPGGLSIIDQYEGGAMESVYDRSSLAYDYQTEAGDGNYHVCYWTVDVLDIYGFTISFNEFDLVPGADVIYVWDNYEGHGAPIYELVATQGAQLPADLLVYGDTFLFAYFVAEGYNNQPYHGFKAYFRVDEVPAFPGDGGASSSTSSIGSDSAVTDNDAAAVNNAARESSYDSSSNGMVLLISVLGVIIALLTIALVVSVSKRVRKPGNIRYGSNSGEPPRPIVGIREAHPVRNVNIHQQDRGEFIVMDMRDRRPNNTSESATAAASRYQSDFRQTRLNNAATEDWIKSLFSNKQVNSDDASIYTEMFTYPSNN